MEEQIAKSLNAFASQVTAFLPDLVTGLIVLLVGLLIAWAAARLAVRLLVFLRLDRIVGRLGGPKTFARGDVRHAFFDMVGWIVGLLTFLIFLDKAILIWQLSLLSKLLEDLLMAIPEFITALLILLIGWGVANGVSRAVLRTLYEERVTRPRFTARIIKAGIITLAAAIALIRLGLAVSLVTHAFLLAFGALALAFALAFGLGSRQAVEAMWQDRRQKREDQRVDQTDQK
jgi:hypothetical protein